MLISQNNHSGLVGAWQYPAVSKPNPSFESSSKYFVAQVRAARMSTRPASTGIVKPLDNESFVALSALVRLVSIAASTPVRSLETEVVVDACCGESCNNCRGVTIRTFSHTAVNNPGLIGVGGRDCSFLFASCNSFHCDLPECQQWFGCWIGSSRVAKLFVECFLNSGGETTKFS